MSASRDSRALLMLSLAVALLVFAGCKDDDDNDGTHNVTVTFEGIDFDQVEHWIIIGSADGGTVLDVRHVTDNGTVTLSGGPAVRITFTLARISQNWGYAGLMSYVNTAQRTWRFDQTATEDSGWVNLLIHYPDGDWEQLSMQTPSGELHNAWNIPDTSVSYAWGFPVNHWENDSRMSILGIIEGASGKLCGWIVDHPFQLDSSNTYSMTLEQPVPVRTITSSRPLDEVWARGLRDESNLAYVFDVSDISNDGFTFALEIPDFPVASHFLQGYYSEETYSYGVWQKTQGAVPTTLTVPDATISADYNETADAFVNIDLQGSPDAIWGWWQSAELEGTSAGWAVYVSRDAATIVRPTLPDSLPIPVGEMHPGGIALDDFNTPHNFDDYVSFMAVARNELYFREYDGAYQYLNYEGFEAPEPVRMKPLPWRPWMPTE